MGSYLGVASESWDVRTAHASSANWASSSSRSRCPPCPSSSGATRTQEYREAYFEHFPGVWRHGDWVTEYPDGSFVIHGRSDSTINRGGIRMGSADITRVVDLVTGVEGSMVIGVSLKTEATMPLFVVPTEGRAVDEVLKQEIIAAIRSEVSPRYVPDEIIEVSALPAPGPANSWKCPSRPSCRAAIRSRSIEPAQRMRRALTGSSISLTASAIRGIQLYNWYDQILNL